MGCCQSKKVSPNEGGKGSAGAGSEDTYDGEIDGWSEHLSDDSTALGHAEHTVVKDGATYAKYWYFKGDEKRDPESSYAMPEAFKRRAQKRNSSAPLPKSIARKDIGSKQKSDAKVSSDSSQSLSQKNTSSVEKQPGGAQSDKAASQIGAKASATRNPESSKQSGQVSGEVGQGSSQAPRSSEATESTASSGAVLQSSGQNGETTAARHEELLRQPVPLDMARKGKLPVLQPLASRSGDHGTGTPQSPLLSNSSESAALSASSAGGGAPEVDPQLAAEQAAVQEAERLNQKRADAIHRDQQDFGDSDLLSFHVRFTGSVQDGQLSRHESPDIYRFHVEHPDTQKMDSGGTVADLQEMICEEFGYSSEQLRLFHQHFECSKSDTIASVFGQAYIDVAEKQTLPTATLDLYVTGEPESPPEYIFKPQQEAAPSSNNDSNEWSRQLVTVQKQTEQAVRSDDLAAQVDCEHQLHTLYTSFTETANRGARDLVDEASNNASSQNDANAPWYRHPNGCRKFVREGVVLQEVRDWYAVQSQSERVSVSSRGKRSRKGKSHTDNSEISLLDEAGILAELELRGLQAVRDCGVEGLNVPLCALVEHSGVTFLATAALPGQGDVGESDECQLVYGSDSQGLVIEDGTADDEAVNKARELSSAMNLRPHAVCARLTQRVHKGHALPLHSQIYRVGGKSGDGSSGGSGGGLSAYFFCGGWRLFPRAVDMEGDMQPMWRRLTPEAFQGYGHGNKLREGWTFLTSRDPVKCSESGEWILDLEFYRYEKRDYAVSMSEYEARKDSDNFKVPGNKLKLHKVPRGMQLEYYKNFETNEVVRKKPINLTPLNPDWSEVGDKDGQREVHQLVCHLLPRTVTARSQSPKKKKSSKKSNNHNNSSNNNSEPNPFAGMEEGTLIPGTGEILLDLVEDLLPVRIEPDADDSDNDSDSDSDSEGGGHLELEESELSVSTSEELSAEMAARGLSVECLGTLLTHLTAQLSNSSKASSDSEERAEGEDPAQQQEESSTSPTAVVPAHIIEICLREIVACSMRATVLALLRSGAARLDSSEQSSDADDDEAIAVLGGSSKYTSQSWLVQVMRRYVNLLMEPVETYEGVARSEASALLWKKISKFSARNFGQEVDANAAAGMSKAPLLHAVCNKLHIRLNRHAGFDFESAAPLSKTDIATVSGGARGLELKSVVVTRLTREGQMLDIEGQEQQHVSFDGNQREQAAIKLNDAVDAAAAIYGSHSAQTAKACVVLAEQQESRHAEGGHELNSKWNHCALVNRDGFSDLASEMYTRASEWYAKQGASIEMARCLVKLAHLSKEHQDGCNATPHPNSLDIEARGMPDCNCIDKLVAAMDVTESLCSEMHPDTADLYMKLAGAYQDMASPEDSSPWLRKGFHVYARLFTTIHTFTKDCWRQLKDVETALNSDLASIALEDLPAAIANLDDEEDWSDDDEYESGDD